MNERLKVFSGNANKALAEEICEFLHVPLGDAELGVQLAVLSVDLAEIREKLIVERHDLLKQRRAVDHVRADDLQLAVSQLAL